MRILIAILLLISITIRPICQIGTLGYYQLHIDTIIEKYCINKAKPKLQCNGKCYLSKQLLLKQEPKDTTQNGVYEIVEAFFPVFFQELSPFRPSFIFTNVSTHTWNIENNYQLEFVNSIDPPPRFS